ncbi:hypothetical protein [Haloechinothrix salitolerans]|uniref:Uncharacterized protein n=1 Tax=Haloechinothrix salitolerans TaxID=926830 RepID=A0ABW2CA43_9PSEU
MPTPSSRLPSVPDALNETELLALGDHLAAAMPSMPPRLLLPTRYAAGLAWDAARWRALPTQLREAVVVEERRLAVASSHAIASAVDWRRVAARPSHTELQDRRARQTTSARTPEQIRATAATSWARVETAIATQLAAGREAA